MAKAFEYTFRRRVIMQVTMGVILLATVGLAAIVDRTLTKPSQLTLGAEQAFGPLHLRVPAEWVVLRLPRVDPQVVAVLVDTHPTGSVMAPRKLIVYRQRLAKTMGPADYLENSGLLSDIFADGQPDGSAATLGGILALRLRGAVEIEAPGGTIHRYDMVICAVFPNRQAVTLRLSKSTEFRAADIKLLDQIAASVRVD